MLSIILIFMLPAIVLGVGACRCPRPPCGDADVPYYCPGFDVTTTGIFVTIDGVAAATCCDYCTDYNATYFCDYDSVTHTCDGTSGRNADYGGSSMLFRYEMTGADDPCWEGSPAAHSFVEVTFTYNGLSTGGGVSTGFDSVVNGVYRTIAVALEIESMLPGTAPGAPTADCLAVGRVRVNFLDTETHNDCVNFQWSCEDIDPTREIPYESDTTFSDSPTCDVTNATCVIQT